MIVTKKEILTTLAFILFITGFTSLALSLVGIRWQFLSWIDDLSPLIGFLVKIGMIISAIIILAVINSTETESNQED